MESISFSWLESLNTIILWIDPNYNLNKHWKKKNQPISRCKNLYDNAKEPKIHETILTKNKAGGLIPPGFKSC